MADLQQPKRSNRKYIIVLLIGLLLLCSLVYQLLLGRTSNFETVYYSPLYSTNVYLLNGDAQISQEFEAIYPGLYRIDLYFVNQQSEASGEVVFQLKPHCAAPTVIETITIEPSRIVSKVAWPVIFEPLDDSAGRTYCMVMASKSTETRSSFGVYASRVDVYPGGEAKYKKNSIEPSPDSNEGKAVLQYRTWLPLVQKSPPVGSISFDIGFTLHYNGPIRATLQTLLGQLTANKPNPFGQPGFYLFLLLLYVGLIGGLWVVVLRGKFGSKL